MYMYLNDLFFANSLFFLLGHHTKAAFEALFVVGGLTEMGDEGSQAQQDPNQTMETGLLLHRDHHV